MKVGSHHSNKFFVLDGPGTQAMTCKVDHAIKLRDMYTRFPLHTVFVIVRAAPRVEEMVADYKASLDTITNLDQIRLEEY